MRDIVIQHINVVHAIDLKNQLLDSGLVMNQDFEWEYHHTEYDVSDSSHGVIPKHTVFRFQDEKLATFYQLKWSGL